MTSSQPSSVSRTPRGGGRGAVLSLLLVAAICGFLAPSDAASGLALLAIAGAAATFGLPGAARVVLGVVVALASVVACLLAGFGDDVLAWGCAAALTAAGVLLVWRGRAWRSMRGPGQGQGVDGGTRPHEPPDLWRALDRGEDPTHGADEAAASSGTSASDADAAPDSGPDDRPQWGRVE